MQQFLAATAANPNDARGWVFLADTYRWHPGGQYTNAQAGEGFTPNIEVVYTSFGPGGQNDTSLWSNEYGDLVTAP